MKGTIEEQIKSSSHIIQSTSFNLYQSVWSFFLSTIQFWWRELIVTVSASNAHLLNKNYFYIVCQQYKDTEHHAWLVLELCINAVIPGRNKKDKATIPRYC